MKFKYFLRGFGTGIVFTSIVLLVAFVNVDSDSISDKEIIERAKKLGMTEQKESIEDYLSKGKSSDNNTKKDVANQTTEKEGIKESSKEADSNETKKEEKTNQATEQKDTTEKQNVTEQTTEKQSTEKKTTQRQTTEKQTAEEQTTEKVTTEKSTTEQTTEAAVANKTVTITIKGGMTSYPVCQKLQELGLIANATDFDNYLIKNGFANRISVGTHSLKIGMSYEEIAIAISDPR